jgi:hypothetical protein
MSSSVYKRVRRDYRIKWYRHPIWTPPLPYGKRPKLNTMEHFTFKDTASFPNIKTKKFRTDYFPSWRFKYSDIRDHLTNDIPIFKD